MNAKIWAASIGKTDKICASFNYNLLLRWKMSLKHWLACSSKFERTGERVPCLSHEQKYLLSPGNLIWSSFVFRTESPQILIFIFLALALFLCSSTNFNVSPNSNFTCINLLFLPHCIVGKFYTQQFLNIAILLWTNEKKERDSAEEKC